MTWPVVEVGELAALERNALVGGPFGSDLTSRNYVPTGVPVIRGANLAVGRWIAGDFVYVSEEKADALAGNCARPGDIVFTQRGTLGQVAIVPSGPFERYLISQSQMKLSVDTSCSDAMFIYYVFSSDEMRSRIRQYSIQTGVPHINLGILRTLEIPNPPIHEQRRIAHLLGTLDDKIESNSRASRLAMALAYALVDRATEGCPDTPYASSLEVLMGSAFKGEAFAVPGVGRPLIRIRDLKSMKPDVWTTESRRDEVEIHPGDIVVGMDAEFRATLWLGQTGLLNQRVCTFRCKAGVGRAFALRALEPVLAFEESAKTGTTVIHLNKADIERFRIPDLGWEDHARLAEKTEPLIDRVVALSVESRLLAELRDVLLPELLAGRIRLSDAETVMEAAM